MQDDINSTPLGLLRCLQVLMEEAACLSLDRTAALLNLAIEACRAESALGPAHLPPATPPVVLH